MIIQAIKTSILQPPKDDLLALIQKSIKKLPEKSILVISSKVVSIWQGRCVPVSDYPDKAKLIKEQADKYLIYDYSAERRAIIALKDNILIRAAGIDASNANDFYILWPKQPMQTAKLIHTWACNEYKVKNLGIIIVDSYSVPLRRGAMGVALGYFGFQPLKDYRNTKDLFGKIFISSQANIVDALATSARLVMGEGAEQTPLALISKLPFVNFSTRLKKSHKKFSSLSVPIKQDIFTPFLSKVKWRKHG
ncbi:MAG: coenzyme F420-0:L-glutamate ligase [bacterium]|nr:coenzyme F420-0:L-glutamate ligase [bacterium]